MIDFEKRRVTVEGREIHMTPTEYELLKYLASNAEKVLTHQTILRAIWGPDHEHEVHNLRVFFSQIRHKIEPDPNRPRYLQTESGIGYRLRSNGSSWQRKRAAPLSFCSGKGFTSIAGNPKDSPIVRAVG